MGGEGVKRRSGAALGTWASLLEEKVFWDVVVAFVGRGEWLYVALVSRFWRDRYREVEGEGKTEWWAAYRTAPRLDFANHFTELDKSGEGRKRLGLYAGNLQVVLLYKNWNTRWDRHIYEGIAERGELRLLQQVLQAQPYSCLAHVIGKSAAKAPTTDVLKWLRSSRPLYERWSDESLRDMMRSAAEFGRINNGAWLLESCRARWHEKTLYLASYRNHLDFVKWARDRGCPWGTWSRTANFCTTFRNERAHAETFSWLHSHDLFPCQCI
jgi:hypothetical protein